MQDHGLQARGITVDEKEQRVVRKHLRTQLHEWVQAVLDLPEFPARAPAVRGRVHDYRVVAVAAADLALHKLFTVVHDVADAARDAREPRVFARALDHALCRVHVHHFGARFGAGDARPARVRKEVEHPDLPARARDERAHTVPVDRLFGEQPRVLEAHRLDLEGQIFVADRPFLGDAAAVFPRAAALVAAAVHRVDARVGEQVAPRRPDHLRIGAQQHDVLPAFQFIAVARGEHGVVFPVLGDAHTLPRHALTTVSVHVSSPISQSLA